MILRPVVLAALALGLLGQGALAEQEIARTIGAWTLTCHRTEAGGRECELRNDEDGRPALEQQTLLSFTLHDGQNEADGLVRIMDLELPPRLGVELAFGSEIATVEGVGRRGRLAARFAMPRQQLPSFAGAEAVRLRFADQTGQAHEVAIPTAGFADALALADDYL
jgi:invasion protein IalB